ncbi:MAG: hypothetical protein B7Y38_11475 [Sphingomonadales bacterium 28-56-43]|nr:MAG: hypothetical protein B7Y38_11475 [Sphingomonadales bacterium 28-56-43]OZA36633.1 MAG: hypothetical protein B7X92_05850 [Novosphingobium sp. 17-62-9]HQS96691.1 DUF4054 domain-containing protein [Novosphingobium sp.]
MAYTAPTSATLKARYTAFATVADATVTYWLGEAAEDCANWSENLRARGEMALAAHRMAEQGIIAGSIPAGVTSFKSGTFSASVSDGVAARTGYDATVYGREFKQLARALFSGPRLAWMPMAEPC